jgi:5-methylcytosine-specific restriction endonuclease McrA
MDDSPNDNSPEIRADPFKEERLKEWHQQIEAIRIQDSDSEEVKQEKLKQQRLRQLEAMRSIRQQHPYAFDQNQKLKYFNRRLRPRYSLDGPRRGREPISADQHFEIWRRDHFTCRYCGRSAIYEDITLEIDHVVPVKRDGSNDSHNLVTACVRCNRRKGSKIWQPRYR